ncbi:uncharacterized protein LOC119264765 isoform X2 [Pygocentrus nattereri]|uniref:uncharacterized protein LOC119264765 isoform X2 n=2 Tax=Pygocentrus nattereri TaxID=42514 RepID=UPI001890ED57|nr:uncharacterized protein LOC119264765 isoform X2 [Pygocentrus nattereri]
MQGRPFSPWEHSGHHMSQTPAIQQESSEWSISNQTPYSFQDTRQSQQVLPHAPTTQQWQTGWNMPNTYTWPSQDTRQGQDVLSHTNAPTAQQGPSRRFINNQCTPVDRTVLEALREMDLKITYLTSLVESFVGGRRILPPQQVQDEEEMNIFPLNSMETLEDLEKRLLNNGLKQRMTNTLSLSGGHTMKKTIWRIASKVFTPNLAKSLNWCGRGDKRGLKQTACGQLIIAAAVKNPALPAPTEAEAEKCLKDYLRLASAGR